MKKCPLCAEEIQDEAIKCRYCGEHLSKEREPEKESLGGVPKYHIRRRRGGRGEWELSEEDFKKWTAEGKIQPMDEVRDLETGTKQYAQYISHYINNAPEGLLKKGSTSVARATFSRVVVYGGLILGIGIFATIVAFLDDKAPQSQNVKTTIRTRGTGANQASGNIVHPSLPGLTSGDLKMNLKNVGLKCGGPKVYKSGYDEFVMWICESRLPSRDYIVEIYGEGAFKIYKVEATSINYQSKNTNGVAQRLFGYVASIPYEGASPQMANGWIKDNIGKNSTKTFGQAKFELSGAGRTRILSIRSN